MNKKSKKNIWTFINSNFGIWLLSSVVISLLTFSYTKYNEYITENNLREKQILKLDQEIECRIYQLLTKESRERDSLSIEKTEISYDKSIKDKWFNFKAKPDSYGGFYNLYPEYAERNIISLVIELSALEINNGNEAESLKQIAHKIINNDYIPLKIQNEEDYKKIILKLNNELRVQRWRKYWPLKINEC